MAKAKRSTVQFKRKQLPAALAARKKNKPMRLKAAARVAKKRQSEASGDADGGAPVAPGPATAKTVDEFLDGAFGGSDDSQSDDDGDAPVSDDSDLELEHEGDGGEDDDELADADRSDSDEEQGRGETAALVDVRASNKALRSELSRHKSELEALKKKDPEFYAFLQSTDASLLDFQDSDEEDDDEEDAEEEPAQGGGRAAKATAAAPADLLTLARAKAWCQDAAQGTSLGAVAKVLRAFRACAHYGDALGDADEYDEAQATLRVTSSAAFNLVVHFVMDDMGRLLTLLLQPDGAGAGKVTGRKAHRQAKFQPETLPRWKKVEPLARSWLSSAHHLLTQLQDADITAYVLRSLAAAAPFAPPFPRRFKHLLRAALGRFGDGQPAVRVAAVTLIRSLAASASTEGLDSCLKGAYRMFAANAKFSGGGGGGQLEHVAFMASAVSELVSLDTGAAYPVAFSAIRQLALLLRNALSARTKDALRAVLCWQTVHCLELWGRVLSAHAAQPTSTLRPLVYPLVQVVTGAGRLVPTARYAPLRLRLLALLQRLGASTGVYIPIAMQAVEVLTFSEVTRAPLTRSAGGGSPSTGGYSSLLRVQKAELRSPSFQAYVVDQGLDLVAEALAQWAYHPAFPELAHLPVRELRRGAKAMHTPALRRGALSVAEAAARNAEWVTQRREAASFAPKDCGPGSQALATFLAEQRAKNAAPLGAILEARRAAARQRAAAAHAVDVRIGGGERTTGADDGDEDGDADREAQQGGSKRKRAAAQAPLSRKAALARQVAAFDEAPAERNDSGEDELAELDLSE